MITPAYVRLMAAYNAEMNRRLYGAAGTLDDAGRRLDRGAFFGSIHATLNHLLWGDRQWMWRFAEWPKPPPSTGHLSLFDDFAVLSTERADTDAGIAAWAATLSQDGLAGELTWLSGASQRSMTRPVAPLIVHLFNHQTHHRGQVHAMLTAAGAATGDTDLPFILPAEAYAG